MNWKTTRTTALLAATALISTACNTAFGPTGIGVNPCLTQEWKNDHSCQRTTRVLAADLVKEEALYLADPNPYLDYWLGNKLPLHAQAMFSNRIVPRGSYVEFFTNGRKIAQGKLDVPAMNGSYAPGFSGIWFEENGIAPGTYPIVAVLKSPAGEELARSNQVSITIPEQAPQGNQIAWLTPPNDVVMEPGLRLPLSVGTHILPADEPGAFVEFYQGDQLLGQGQLNADGNYELEWNTSGLGAGVYPLRAVLKAADGRELAETRLNHVTIQPTTERTAALINLSGKPVIQAGEILDLDAIVQLNLPVIFQGTELELFANGEPIGKAFVTKDGNYLLKWDTRDRPTGDYELEVIVRDGQGRQLAKSAPLTIKIEGMAPPVAGNLGANALSLNATGNNFFPGVRVPLKATINAPDGQVPDNAVVDFVYNGEVIGQGVKQPDGSFLLNWDTQNRPPGDYPIEAILRLPNGEVLAKSLVENITLTGNSQNRIDLISGSQSAPPGSTVKLEATVNANPQELANGAYVDFVQNGEIIGRGTLQADGTYSFDWNTVGKPVGEYPVTAILRSGIGVTLAESNVGTIILSDNTQNEIELLSTALTGKPGEKFDLQARATISSLDLQQGAYVEFWQDQARLGRGSRGNDGVYHFEWDTTGLKLGRYPIKAVLRSGKTNAIIAQSLNGNVTLDDTVQNKITLVTPVPNTTSNIGAQLALKAEVDVTPEQRQAGFVVEFYQGDRLLGQGAPQSDGTYLGVWNTSGYWNSQFPIRALLKSPQANKPPIAESQQILVTLRSPGSGGGGGGGGGAGGAGGNNGGVQQAGSTAASIQVQAPANGYRELLNNTIPLRVKALFNPTGDMPVGGKVEFFIDGGKIGEATTDTASDEYTLNWNTTGQALGNHNFTARTLDQNGQQQAVTGTPTVINLINNSVAFNQPAPNFNEAIGQTLTLQATPEISTQQEGKVGVKFYLGDPNAGGTELGDGIALPDGSYTFNWNTTGQAAGGKDLYARLMLNDPGPATQLAVSPVLNGTLVANQISMTAPANNTVQAIGSQLDPIRATVVTSQSIRSTGRVRFFNNGVQISEITGATNFVATANPNEYTVTLPSVPNPNSYDTTGLTGANGFTAQLLNAQGQILQVSTANTVNFINSDISLILPENNQVERIGDSVVLQASVDVLPADVPRPKRVDFFVDGVKVGEDTTGSPINGQNDKLSFTFDWISAGVDRNATVIARYFVNEGAGFVQRGNDSPSRTLVLISNQIKWIRTPGQQSNGIANPYDALVNDSLGLGTITNNDATAAANQKIRPDTLIVEAKLTPAQVTQIANGQLKLGLEVEGVSPNSAYANVPDAELQILGLDGTASTAPIASPGATVDHADQAGSVTLPPGVYRYRLRWAIDNNGANNDASDDTNATPSNAALKNLRAELQTNTNSRLAISANDTSKGRVNLFATNIIGLNQVDGVNSRDTGTTTPVSIGRTNGDTRINVLSDVGKPGGAPVGISLQAAPILNASQRGVAQVVFYKNNGGGKVEIGRQTTGAASTYTLNNIPVPEGNGTNITYSAELENLLDQGGNPINGVLDEDFATAVTLGVDLTTPADNTVLNDGANSNQNLRATPRIPHRYTNTYGAGTARVRFDLEGDLNGGNPTVIRTDTTIGTTNNSASQSWPVNFNGIENTNVGANTMSMRALLDINFGAGFTNVAADTHTLTARNHNVDLTSVRAFLPAAPGNKVDINNNDNVVFDNDGVAGNQTETIEVVGTVNADAPPEVATVRLFLNNAQVASQAYAGPGAYTFNYVPTTGSTANLNDANASNDGVNHRFRIQIHNAAGNELDRTGNRDVDVIQNTATLTGINAGGIYHSGCDTQAQVANRGRVQDTLTLGSVLSLSKLQESKNLSVRFNLEGAQIVQVAGAVGQTTFSSGAQTLNCAAPFTVGDDRTAQPIILEGGAPLFNGQSKDIDLVNPEVTFYAIDKSNDNIERINSRTGTKKTLGKTRLSDGGTVVDSFGIAKDPVNGDAYFVSRFDINNTISNRLVRWSPRTGLNTAMSDYIGYSTIAQINTGTSSTARLGFNQNGDGLYLSLSTFAGLEIYRVNKGTGALSAAFTITGVDASSFTNIEGDMAFDTDGTMYLAHGANLYRSTHVVDNTTSTVNLQLMPGYVATDNIFGVSIDEDTANSPNTRLIVVRKVGANGSEMVEVNKGTGAASNIQSYAANQYTDVSGSHNIP